MAATVQRFHREFLNASSGTRAALVQKAVSLNQQNTGIVNLLANVDINYKPTNNQAQEAQIRNRPENIFFICKMLQAFPDFRYQ